MARDIREVTTCTDDTVAERPTATQPTRSILTAVVDDISPEGVPRILVSGESHPRSAATMVRFPTAAAASEALLGQTVLVLDDVNLPTILGVVGECVWERRGDEGVSEVRASLPAGQAVHVQVDKRRVDIEATDEIRLTCGKSALVMRRDGTVIVRGVKIVSRASGTHRIMGATVGIN